MHLVSKSISFTAITTMVSNYNDNKRTENHNDFQFFLYYVRELFN